MILGILATLLAVGALALVGWAGHILFGFVALPLVGALACLVALVAIFGLDGIRLVALRGAPLWGVPSDESAPVDARKPWHQRFLRAVGLGKGKRRRS